MAAFRWISVHFLLILFSFAKVNCKFEFTNINCTSFDTKRMEFDECLLKSVNRTYKYMTIRLKIYEFPVNNVTARVKVLKRLNGYKPFLYDFFVDGCKVLKGGKSKLIQFLYDLFASYSNINHSCPYNHDVYIEKLPISYLDYKLSVVLPMPEGYYCLHTIYSGNNRRAFDLKIYFHIY